MPVRMRRTVRRLWVPIAVRAWPLARIWYSRWGLQLEGHANDDVWYFAYGSNMHDSAFRERRRMQPRESRVGRVQGYRLRFNLDGSPRGRAAPANISICPESEVWGVLYRITFRDLVRLNATEGVPGRNYQPVNLPVEDKDGNALTAITYVADGNEQDGNPSLRYITLLREGARRHGLPDHWIDHLDAVRPAE